MQCEYFALEGLSDLVNSVKLVHANLNSKLSSIGLLRVMFDPRVTLSQDVSAQLLEHFGRKVFSTIIPKMCGSLKLLAMDSLLLITIKALEVTWHIKSLARNY